MNDNILSFDSSKIALKILLEGTIPLSVAGGMNQWATVTVPHGYGSDKLLWQVTLRGIAGSSSIVTTPFISGDGRLLAIANLDATNLYITAHTSSASTPWDPTTWQCEYRIFIP